MDKRTDSGDFYPGGKVLPRQPGEKGFDPSKFVKKTDDDYRKSFVLDGVQHYKKVTIDYSEKQEEWGFNLVGDYILVNGEFVEYQNPQN